MDITVSTKKRFTNAFFNGEVINYIISVLASFLTIICFKQLFKTFFGIKTNIACLLAFIIGELVLFLLEKFFVYRSNALNGGFLQIIYAILNAGVHLGFFAAFSFLGNLIGIASSAIWLFAFVFISILNYAASRILIFDCLKNASEFKKGRVYRCFFRNRFVVLSAVVSFLLLAFIYSVYKTFPFGDITILRMDLYHQYGPLFTELYDRVVQRKSFLYSWTSGGGSSFLGNYFNYLASPFSALIFLFDRKDIPYAISMIAGLKSVFSAAFFTFYIKKSLSRHSAASAAFGVMYSLSAYFLAYYWNVMWLDGMMILPLITLGIENIVNKRKNGLFLISLVYIFYSSYYIGYMTAIYSVVYFLAYFLLTSPDNPIKFTSEKGGFAGFIDRLKNNRFVDRGLAFASTSVIAGLICAAFLIPVFFILRSCSATSDDFPSGLSIYFNLFDFLQTHFAGLKTTIRSSGEDVLPNIYSSVLALILVPLFMINKEIRIREKTIYALLIGFFLISFNLNYANFFWHALHFPNDLPYRFSYMYSFLLLVIAFKSLMKLKGIDIKEIGICSFIWIAIIAVSSELPTEKFREATPYICLGFILTWTLVLFLIKNKTYTKSIISLIFFAAVICEAILGDINSDSLSFYNSLKDYNVNYSDYTAASDYIRENDDGDFRYELCRLNTRMDDCLYDLEGMSIFSSMAYEKYSGLQYSLGNYGNRINSFTYNTQTPVYNLMYNIKYLIYKNEGTRPSTQLFTKYYNVNEECSVYENDYFLPKAFCVNRDIDIWSTAEGNPFTVQADFFTLATGFSGVFTPVQFTSTSFTGLSGNDITEMGTQWITKQAGTSYSTLDFSFDVQSSGNTYIYVSCKELSNIDVSTEDSVNSYNISTPYIIDLGYYDEGSHINVSVDCSGLKDGESGVEIFAYSLNQEVLDAGYNALKDGAMEVTKSTDTKLIGTVVSSDNNILYSSIPYDEGWSVYIDGEKQKTFEIGDCQLGVMIKPGEHTIEYSYSPKGLKAGVAVSAATIICLIAYAVYEATKKPKETANKSNGDNLVKTM